MSTDDFGDRTQRPTDRRRREARARAEVARSTDLVCALVLLATTTALWWIGPSLANELASLMRSSLTTVPSLTTDSQMIAAQLLQIATKLSVVVLPILLVGVGAAAIANLLQTGFLWVPTSVLPQFERLNPTKGFGRWFAMSSWIGLMLSLIKLGTLLAVLLVYMRSRLESGGPLMSGSAGAIIKVAASLMGELAIVLSLSLVTLALVDYSYQYWRQEHALMMTVEEVRREQREDEANPQVKRQQRAPASTAATPKSSDIDGIRPV